MNNQQLSTRTPQIPSLKSSLNIAHLNINSIAKKFHELSAIITLRKLDILCLSETRLNVNHELNDIIGFKTYRKDSSSSSERGIAILCNDQLNVREVDLPNLCISDNTEFLILKVQFRYLKSFFVICVYRHPNYLKQIREKDYEFMHSLLASLKETNHNFYILGNFNLRNNTAYSPLERIILSYHTFQVIDQPTRMDNLLDLIIISDKNSLLSTSVYQPFLSDHCLTECLIVFPKKTVHLRNYAKIDLSALHSDIHTKALDLNTQNFDLLFLDITTFILDLFNKHCPVKEVHFVQYPNRKYLSSSTKQMIR
jgi:hypothetical protein